MPAFAAIDPIAGLIFAGSLAAFGSGLLAAAAMRADRLRARATRRLERVGARPGDPLAAARAGAGKRDQGAHGRQLDAWLRSRLPMREALQERLARTGRKISLVRYVSASVAIMTAAAALLLLLGFPVVPAVALGLLLGLLLPHAWVGMTIRRRTAAFLAQFPEAIDQIVRGVRSGLPVGEAIAGIARELGDPIASEFQTVVDSVRLGRTLEEALLRTGRRLGVAEFNFLVITMIVQKETGGNLAETLENLSDIVRRRQQMQQKVRAMSSEARASALIVGSLPFVLSGILLLVNPDYLSKLFTDPRGLYLLGAGLASEGLGFLVMMKMARFEI